MVDTPVLVRWHKRFEVQKVKIFKWITDAVFLPGDIVIKLLGLNVETDGGIFRTMINTCFWGAVALILVANYA